MGRLEGVLDLFSADGSDQGTFRLVSFGEFERFYEKVLENGEEWQRKDLAVASNPLVSFQPEDRPVYWRLLMVQACLYQALLRTSRDHSFLAQKKRGWTICALTIQATSGGKLQAIPPCLKILNSQ